MKRLRELRPDTPIVVAEEATSATAWYWQKTGGKPYVAEKCQAQRAIVRKLQESGFKELYYIDGEWLFGEHGETSPDNCHPGDIGMMNMADKFTPVIEKNFEKAIAFILSQKKNYDSFLAEIIYFKKEEIFYGSLQ